jgi:hypothetical protein
MRRGGRAPPVLTTYLIQVILSQNSGHYIFVNYHAFFDLQTHLFRSVYTGTGGWMRPK